MYHSSFSHHDSNLGSASSLKSTLVCGPLKYTSCQCGRRSKAKEDEGNYNGKHSLSLSDDRDDKQSCNRVQMMNETIRVPRRKH